MGLNQEVKNFKGDVENYLEAKLVEVELGTVEKSVHMASHTMGWLIVGLLSTLCFSLLTVVLVLLLKETTGSYLISTAIVGGVFALLTALVSLFFKKLLYRPIKSFLYGLYFETKEDLA